MAWQVRGAAVGCLTLLVLMTGCAGGGGGSGARPSASLSISTTRSVPSPTGSPIPTQEPTEGASATPTGGPSKTDTPETPKTSATPQPSPTQPSPTQPSSSPTEASTTGEPTGTGSTSPAPSSSPSEAEPSAEGEGEGDSTDDGVPAWVWWLLAAVLVAAIVLAWWLVARTRRRRRWEGQLQAAEGDAAWLARALLPQLKSTGSREGVAGGWQVGLPRVAALEDQLTVLEASAPAEDDGARARTLRDAVRTAHARVDAITAGGPQDTWARDIDEAIALLEAALAPSVQSGP